MSKQSVSNVIELFAGAGGLALGFAQAGFSHLALLEFNKIACETLRVNWKKEKSASPTIYEKDVREINYAQTFGSKISIDGIIGGPPCQPFSLGGIGLGSRDARNMFPEAARAVAELQPKFFVFENVKGLLRTSFSRYFEYVVLQLTYPFLNPLSQETWEDHLKRLKSLRNSKELDAQSTYRVAWKLVNAADYDTPQYRERVFIIGYRGDLNIRPTFPKPTRSYEKLLWDKWIEGQYWEEHKIAKKDRPEPSVSDQRKVTYIRKKFGLFPPSSGRYITTRDAIADLPDPQIENAVLNHEYRSGARPYAGHTGSDYDEPSKALKAGVHGAPGGENMIAFPDGTFRYYTPREAARIQTFPDAYRFCGSTSEILRQLGNAAPVKLSEIVAKHILKQIA